MPRDYKHRANRSKKRATLSPWIGVLAGLLIGLFVAFLIFIKLQAKPGEPVYIQETLPPAAISQEEEVREVHQDETAVIPPPPKPRFDFYTLLPEMEVVIPEEVITESLKQTAHPPAATPPAARPASNVAPQATVKPAAPATPAPLPKPAPGSRPPPPS